MKLLENRIKKDGVILEDNMVKVDGFLNHQVDCDLLDAMADEWISHIDPKKITKVLSVESSGVPIAFAVARKLKVTFVFAKKKESVNLSGDVYSSKVISYTHFREYDVIVSKKFLSNKDNVLIIDDILANGSALKGLLKICKQAEANVEAIGIALEKTFQAGSREIREFGYTVDSLARIKSIDAKTGNIEFEK